MCLELGELDGEAEPPGLVSPCWPGHSTQSKARAAEDSLPKGPDPRPKSLPDHRILSSHLCNEEGGLPDAHCPFQL